MNSNKNGASDQNHMAQKEAYEKPAVVTFGSVTKLTQGVGGSHQDSGHNNSTKLGRG